MGAAVRIDEGAFGDSRIRRLGRLAGVDEFGAMGRLVHIWRACTDRETDVLSPATIDAITDLDGFCAALLRADLGEEVANGIRIKGCRGRIEWLAGRRQSALIAGKARAEGARRDGHGRFGTHTSVAPASAIVTPASTQRHAGDTLDAHQRQPASSSPPSPSPSREQQSPSGDCAPATPSRSSGQDPGFSPEAAESPPLHDRPPTRVWGPVAPRSTRGGRGRGLPDETQKVPTPQGELWTTYATLYRSAYGEDPTPTKDAFAQFARVAKATGLEAAKLRISAAFARPPSWIEGRLNHRALIAAWDSIGEAAPTAEEAEAAKLKAALDRLAARKRIAEGPEHAR